MLWPMIHIARGVFIDEQELELSAIRASGPGGQHVNKTSSAVQLRFDTTRAAGLPQDVVARLRQQAGSRMTQDGVLVIEAREHRSQHRNRAAAIERLVELLRRAAVRPRVRRKTKPTRASRERRLDEKRRQSERKSTRRHPGVE
jgi:ribosome-associated protein